MDHSHADQIMKQVERYYRGDFLVNGDQDYSHLLAKQYHKLCAKHFNGSNGHFTAEKMFCSAGCEREGKAYRIPPGGIVYGPYYAFLSGDYEACFELEGDLAKCTVSAFSGVAGTIAKGWAEELAQGGKIVLRFSLPESVDDLELKVFNKGDGYIIFHSVHVSGCAVEYVPKESAEIEEKSARAVERDIRWQQRTASIGYRDLQDAAECALPKESRFRAVKLFFRKLLNSYITFQLAFNRKLVSALWAQNSQIQTVTRAVAEQTEAWEAMDISAMMDEIKQLRCQTEEQEKKLREQQEQIDKLAAACRSDQNK